MKRPLALLTLAALLAAVLLVPALAQDAAETPLPPVDIGDAQDIPQSLTSQGYAQLGSLDAPVQVIAFCAFDSTACAGYQHDVFPLLVERIAAGEAQIAFVPLHGANEVANGRGAARAAICAAEQGAFWTYSDALYTAQQELGDAAFASANLIAIADSLGINRTPWDECLLSDRPDAVLERGALDAELQIGFTDAMRPYVLVNGVPSLPDTESVLAAVNQEVGQFNATPDPASTAEATEPPIVITVEPLLGEQIEPPLDITLPDGWLYGYDALLLNDVDVQMRAIPLAVYTGPVSGGTGTIILLWGFPNLVNVNPFQAQTASPDLWSDGLRLLRLAIIEQDCNIGTDVRTDYTIGGLTAQGTQFSAVDCPELPDTRGWFAGLQEGGINFVFFVYTESIDAMSSAQPELQAILDSVQFRVPEVTPAP